MPTITLYLGTKSRGPEAKINLPPACHLRSVWDTIKEGFTQSEQMILLLVSTRNRYLIYFDSEYISKKIKLSDPISRKIENIEITDIAYSNVIEIYVLPLSILPQLEEIENLQQQILLSHRLYVNGDKKKRTQTMTYRNQAKELLGNLLDADIQWTEYKDESDRESDDQSPKMTSLLRALSMEANAKFPTAMDETQEIIAEDYELAMQLHQELNFDDIDHSSTDHSSAGHRAIKRLASGGIAVHALTGQKE